MTSLTFDWIKQLAEEKKLRFSLHAFERLAEENITAREVVDGVSDGTVVEDYPDYHVGPCVLVLQSDYGGLPFHVVWGIPKLDPDEAVVVTSYRPDPDGTGDMEISISSEDDLDTAKPYVERAYQRVGG